MVVSCGKQSFKIGSDAVLGNDSSKSEQPTIDDNDKKVDSRIRQNLEKSKLVQISRGQAVDEDVEVNLEVADNCTSEFLTEMTDSQVKKQIGIRSYKIKINSKYVMNNNMEQLIQNDPCIIRLSPVFILKRDSLGDDLLINEQKQLNTIRLDDAIETLNLDDDFGGDTIIAIIDSGVDLLHEDIKDNAWFNPGEMGNDSNGIAKHKNGIDDDGNGYIDDCMGYNFAENNNNAFPAFEESSHGTHVAGLAAARSNNGIGIRGVNGRAKIMALNVFGRFTGAPNSNTENAVRYATDNGADVINLSLGHAGYSPSLEAAVAYATSRNVVVIIAAGNKEKIISSDRNSPDFDSPASLSFYYPGAIAVSSIDSLDSFPSTFSNFSDSVVEIAAPGCHLYSVQTQIIDGEEVTVSSDIRGLISTAPGDKYIEECGTSQAAPVVAGAVSLLIQKLKDDNKTINNEDIKRHLKATGAVNSKITGLVVDAKQLDVLTLLNTEITSVPVVEEKEPVTEDHICLTGIIEEN